MQSLPPLASEINRMVRYLAGAGAGLSLLSASTSSLPTSVIQTLMTKAAKPNDILGTLIDGSIGCLTIRPRGDRGEEDLELDFLERLQIQMTDLSERRMGGRVTLWLRAVHRPAVDIAHAPDLINCLFDAPSTPVTVTTDNDPLALDGRISLFPRVPTLLMPFIEPVERQAPVVKMALSGAWPQSLE